MNRRSALKLLGALIGGAVVGCETSGALPGRPENMDKLAADNNAFAFDLYGKLRERGGNLFVSPASISTALAMTYAGARERTAEQMAKAMHFALPADKLHPAFGALLADFGRDDSTNRGYQLAVANALWGQKGYSWREEFLKLTRAHYGAGLHEVDFQSDASGARKIINAWVEKQTHDKIQELIREGILNQNTRMVLTNAIYFKGDWATRFDKKVTFDQAFHVSAEKQVKVPMMHRTGPYRLYGDQDVQVLDMPYKGNELSMLVVLPKKVDGLEEVENRLSAERLSSWDKGLREEEKVNVTLPKFKMTSEFSLAEQLAKLGMTDAFDMDAADFSGMDGRVHWLYIAAVLHKTYVDVNEEGTEAAGATAVVVAKREARPAERIPTFQADHPFLFAIRDNRSGSILFMGRVTDPSR
jgi:serpin B